jgi:hypothetical protein
VTDTNVCQVAHKEDMMPAWPTFSPDGKTIAYVTQLKTPRLVILPIGGKPRDLGPAVPDCPPVWSSPDQLWVHEGFRHSYWAERDIASGRATGRKIDFPPDVEPGKCWWPEAEPGTPFFRAVRVERRENSRLLSLSGI